MRLYETKETYIVDSEAEAVRLSEAMRNDAAEKGYILNKCGFEKKTKTSKGEIIAEEWLVNAVKRFGNLWELEAE